MKLRTKSYIITHIAHGANLRLPALNKPVRYQDVLKWVLLIASILYFIIGAKAAEVDWLPSRPSNDLNTFERQVIMLNGSRLLDQIKQNNPSIKRLEQLPITDLTKNRDTTIQSNSKFSTKFGASPKSGRLYAEIKLVDSSITNEVNLISKQYLFQIHYNSYTLRYQKPWRDDGYSIMVDKSFKIE